MITARLAAPSAPAWDAPLAEPAPFTEAVRPLPAERTRRPASESVRADAPAPNPGGNTGIASAPDAAYYAARELDFYPALTTPLDLHELSGAGGMRGRALLAVRIDAHGIVEEVSVIEAEPGGSFAVEARRVFLSARFTPALKNGRAVKSRVLIRVDQGGEGAAQ